MNMNPNNILARAILNPHSSSSMATLSASPPFPTVTLDLTHSLNPNNPNQFPFQRPPVPHFQATHPIFSVSQTPFNQSRFSGLHLSHHQHQPSLTDAVSKATAAVTADPNFAAVLAAAISSIIGGAQPNSNSSVNGSSVPNIIDSSTISGLSGN